MANIHVSGSGNPRVTVGGTPNAKISTGNTTMPKYVGARAVVDRVEEGVRITLTDFRGTTQEIIAEAIANIVTNDDGTLTFVLPDGREITTNSLKGPQGDPGLRGEDGIDGIDGIDGYSPTANVTKSGHIATITITDKLGTTTAEIRDGIDGVGSVTDVKVNGASVVSDSVADVTVPEKVSDLVNDSGFVNGDVATSSTNGLMASSDKAKLDSILMTNNVIDPSVLPPSGHDVVEAYPVSGSTELSAGWLSASSGGAALTPEAGKIYILMADTAL